MPNKKAAKKPSKQTAKKTAAEYPWIHKDLWPLAVAIDELKLDPQNARTHDESNVQAIVGSLKRFGQVKPIVVHAQTGVIEAGNGTFRAAEQLGWTHLAAVRVDHDRGAALGFAIADNRTAELAGWDDALLAELLPELETDDAQLYADLLLADLAAEEEAEEEAEEGGGGEGQQVPDTYQVLVDCGDQQDQKQLYEKLKREGRTCRLLTI